MLVSSIVGEKNNKEVNGSCQLFGYQICSKYFLLCWAEERMSYRFGVSKLEFCYYCFIIIIITQHLIYCLFGKSLLLLQNKPHVLSIHVPYATTNMKSTHLIMFANVCILLQTCVRKLQHRKSSLTPDSSSSPGVLNNWHHLGSVLNVCFPVTSSSSGEVSSAGRWRGLMWDQTQVFALSLSLLSRVM